MICLKSVSTLYRVTLSTNMRFPKFYMKKSLHVPFLINTNVRVYSYSSVVGVLKTNAIPVLRKPYIGNCNKVRVTFNTERPVIVCSFHTSEQRYFHPIVWAVARPVLKIMAVLTGRAFRKWWRDLPPNKKEYFLERIKENRRKLALYALACIFLSMAYYASHIEETPITKRKRFIAFNPKQLEKINEFEFQQVMLKLEKDILPANHPSSLRTKAIVDRIVKANWHIKEIRDKKFGVSVINSSLENAFVLPNGHVCMFAGMLSLCSTDDELAIIISHEIAHCIQNHGAEKVSFTHLLDLISILIIAVIWAIIPSDSLSLLAHFIYSKAMNILFELPYNRHIETEADTVGLHLAAKACFDIRESSAFWSKMSILHKNFDQVPDIEFLSTHPSHESRSVYLDSIMDEALKYRQECGCPKLKPVDPRLNVEIMAKTLEAARRKFLLQNPKPVIPIYV